MKVSLSILLISLCSWIYASPRVDSLINYSEQNIPDSAKVKVYNEIAYSVFKSDLNLAEGYFNKALKIIHTQKTDDYKLEKARSYNGLGIVYRRKTNYANAIEHYQRALKIYQSENDTGDIAETYLNIAIVYRDLKEYDKALDFMNQSLNLITLLNDTSSLPFCYNSIGMIYRRKEDYYKAIDYYNKSLQVAKQINDQLSIANSYNNLGVAYAGINENNKALDYYKNGFEIHQKIDNKYGIGQYYLNSATIHKRLKQYDKAIDMAKKGLEVFKEMDNKMRVFQAYKDLSNYYTYKKDYKQSLQNYKLYIDYRDSVYNEKNTKELTEKQMQFEFDLQLMADSLKRVEQEKISEIKHNQELKRKQTYIYFSVFIIAIVIIFSILIFSRLKHTKRQNSIIAKQKLVVEEKNKEILDSINYAKRIQNAILPKETEILSSLPNSFILYKPKDIVAGDFYWYYKLKDKILIAVADCTGHGVPGAMVSVVCNNALNRAIKDFNLTTPAEILDKTAQLVKHDFAKSDEDVKDGMDVALCSFDFNKNELEFAGAVNPLYYIKDNELKEIKGDKQPIGLYSSYKPFNNHKIKFEKGNQFYIFSDGYADQFGGEKGKKFMLKRFKNLLQQISDFEPKKQQNILEEEFNNWKQNNDQIDDVCIVGIKV